MQQENKRLRKVAERNEIARIRKLVTISEKNDPRIKAFNAAKREAREQKSAQGKTAKKSDATVEATLPLYEKFLNVPAPSTTSGVFLPASGGGEGVNGRAEAATVPAAKSSLWTKEDEDKFQKLSIKFPTGAPRRWANVADAMGKAVEDVLLRVKNVQALPREKAGRKAGVDQEQKEWTAEQESAFVEALKKFPASCGKDRWISIAKLLPGKSVKDCIAKYKALRDAFEASQS